MKFPVDKCVDCGLDLTTAEPTEVTHFGEMTVGTCPSCPRTYIMVEGTPPSLPELEAPETEPAPEPEPVAEAEPEPKPEPEAEAPAGEPEPTSGEEEKRGV